MFYRCCAVLPAHQESALKGCWLGPRIHPPRSPEKDKTGLSSSFSQNTEMGVPFPSLNSFKQAWHNHRVSMNEWQQPGTTLWSKLNL